MKRLWGLQTTMAIALFLLSSAASPQLVDEAAIKAWGTPIGGEAISKLVSDRTWHIDWAACMGGSNGCKTYWDFFAAGTLCARGIDATRKDKCADDGEWKIEKNMLCWELTWMGGGSGYKSTCIFVKTTGNEEYEATRSNGIGLTMFRFKLAKD